MKNLTKGQLFVLNNLMSALSYSSFDKKNIDKYFTLRLAISKEAEDVKKSVGILREETKPEALKKEGSKEKKEKKELEELEKEWKRLHDEATEKSVSSKESETDTHIFTREEILNYASCNASKIVTAEAEFLLMALIKE